MVLKHGNAKVDVPFHPTWPSTRKIRLHCSQQGPKAVVATVSAAAGGVLAASAPGKLPRNEKQIANFKACTSSGSAPGTSCNIAADDLFSVTQQAYTEDSAEKFIRAVSAAPQPAIHSATDQQLHDPVRFCPSAFEF